VAIARNCSEAPDESRRRTTVIFPTRLSLDALALDTVKTLIARAAADEAGSAVCVSRNRVVCHGMPSVRERLEDGDIVNIDVTSHIDGFHGTIVVTEDGCEGTTMNAL
jgi:methionine aminopeptidase